MQSYIRVLNVKWLITTAETFGREFKLSVEDLDIRMRVWVWIWRLVYKSLAKVLGVRYPEKVFIKSSPSIN